MTDNLNQSYQTKPDSPSAKEPQSSGSFFRFASIMTAMVIAGIIASFIWQNYFSPQVREVRLIEEQIRGL